MLGAETLKIKALLNPLVQILFFSATYSKKIMIYARKIVPKAFLVTPRSDEELVLGR
jgi:superfamily II DNA/RNA helicase